MAFYKCEKRKTINKPEITASGYAYQDPVGVVPNIAVPFSVNLPEGYNNLYIKITVNSYSAERETVGIVKVNDTDGNLIEEWEIIKNTVHLHKVEYSKTYLRDIGDVIITARNVKIEIELIRIY